MIPKILHYCRFGGGQQDDVHRRCLDSWTRVLPDYTIRIWDESNSPLYLDYCLDALDQGLWSKLSNFVRLWALYEDGGLYFDTDVEAIRPLDPLLGEECFLGFQRVEEIPGWVNNAVLGAQSRHPFLLECMDLTLAIYAERGEFVLSPRLTTQVLKRRGLCRYGDQVLAGVRLCPVDYFYPYSWLETFRPDCITGNTYTVHHWSHSWAHTEARRLPQTSPRR